MLRLAATTAIIQPIDNHNGILVLKEARAQYQTDTYHLAIIYNTTRIRDIFIDICSNYYTFRLKQSNISESTTIIKQIDYTIDIIESKLTYLGLEIVGVRTSYRQKRGLINGLGSIIKAITGNLDQDDAMKFENEIRNVQSSINNNINNQRKTLSIMREFMKDYENNLKHIENNQKEIYTTIDKFSTQLSNLESKVLTNKIFSEIKGSLQQLYNRLETLENAITFSHLGKMHPSIIDPIYLIEELNFIQNEIKTNLVISPNLKNIHLWEKVITVKAYDTNQTLNFILEIPLVAKQTFNLLHLYSIPNNNNTLLIPKNPLLILGNNEFAYPHEPCEEIKEDYVICRHLNWQTLSQSNDCIAQLIQHLEPHNCTYVTANLENDIIHQIKENSWIILIKKEEVIKTTCGNEITYRQSKGAFLITVDNNCEVLIGERTLSTHRKNINIEETIPLPHVYQTPKLSPYKIKLEDMELDNLKNTMKQIDTLPTYEDNLQIISNTPSWLSICLYIILSAAVIGVIAYKFWRKSKKAKSSVQQAPEEIQLNHQSLKPTARLSLKGGGVMSS